MIILKQLKALVINLRWNSPSTLFTLFFVYYCFTTFYTLSSHPLPWLDEVYFSSVADHLRLTGLFEKASIAHLVGTKAEYSYGPVFFSTLALWYQLFGLSIVSHRLFVWLFVLLSGWALFKIANKSVKNSWLQVFIPLLFFFDPFIDLASHQGRMDSMALFFVLLTYYYTFCQTKKQTLAGVFALLAILTTPRALFFVFPTFLLLLLQTIRSKQWRPLFAFCLPTALLYPVWIGISFGSITDFFHYHWELFLFFSKAVVFTWYIPRQEWPLIFVTLVVFSLSIFKYNSFKITYLEAFCLLNLTFFYLFIFDYGPYSVFILPSYYLLLTKRADVLFLKKDEVM